MEQGLALLEAGRFHEAVQAFGQALQAVPLAWEPRVGISKGFEGIGDGWAAVAWLADACRVAPGREDLWLDVVRLLGKYDRQAELDVTLQAALAACPLSPRLLAARAELALEQKRYADGVALYARLHEIQPDIPAVLLNYGYCLEQVGAVEKAVALYRRAVDANPGFLEAHVNLSGVLWRVQDFYGALDHAKRAVELGPEHPFAVRILGTAYLNLNRPAEAEDALRRALALQPGFSLAEVDLAFTLLLAGRLEEGWRMYHLRWRDAERMRRPEFFHPEVEWQGRVEQPLAGRRIAVYAEQGLGDVIQFLRYIDLLHADGAKVSAVIQAELVDLVEHSFPGVTCLREGVTLHADHHVALLDLPMHFGTTTDNVPARVPYLQAPEAKLREWEARLPARDGRQRVGIAWSGSLAQVNNNNRAVRLSQLRPLFEHPALHCFSLQKADVGLWTDVAPGDNQLSDYTAEWKDFTDSAAMLEQLDLVVTVDTSIAHLAGALGKEVWVLLPPNADWRYLLEREDTPWYPSMRLFRRGHAEPRASQVDRVMAALEERLARTVPAAP